MGIDAPRLRQLQPVGQVGQIGASRGPQPESAVDVHPGTGSLCSLAAGANGVEGAGINVPCLQDEDAGFVQRGQGLRAQAPLIVDLGIFDGIRAKAEQCHALEHGRMRVAAGDQPQARRGRQSGGVDVTAQPLAQPPACGSKAADDGHRSAADEACDGLLRQPQQLDQPALADLFKAGIDGRDSVNHRVLVPRVGQQARSERCGQQAAIDHAEEASSHLRCRRRTADAGEPVEDCLGLARSVRQGTVKPGKRGLRCCIRVDRPVADPAQVGLPVLDGAGEQAAVLHLLVHGLMQRALIRCFRGRWGRGLVGHDQFHCASPAGWSRERG